MKFSQHKKKHSQKLFISNWILNILFEDKESVVKMLLDQRSAMIDAKNCKGRTSLSLVAETNGITDLNIQFVSQSFRLIFVYLRNRC